MWILLGFDTLASTRELSWELPGSKEALIWNTSVTLSNVLYNYQEKTTTTTRSRPKSFHNIPHIQLPFKLIQSLLLFSQLHTRTHTKKTPHTAHCHTSFLWWPIIREKLAVNRRVACHTLFIQLSSRFISSVYGLQFTVYSLRNPQFNHWTRASES